MIDPASPQFLRMKMEGSTLVAGDETYVYNAAKDTPAIRARIAVPPVQYQGKWFDEEDSKVDGRPEIADRMCKSHYDKPDEARRNAEDGFNCNSCSFNPWVKTWPGNNAKCGWRGDIALQILPDGHDEFTEEDPIWTLTLPMTSMMEFQGTRAEPEAGVATAENFMFKLSRFAAAMADDWGVDQRTAVTIGLMAYQAGGVVADVRLPKATSKDKSKTWNVISFDPVHIEKDFAAPIQTSAMAIEANAEAKTGDDLPF